MKKFLAAMIVVFVVTALANRAEASGWPLELKNLDQIVGNWYDTKGNLVLTVSSDHKFNGNKILSFERHFEPDLEERNVYAFKIVERNGTREIYVEYSHVATTSIDYHECLKLYRKQESIYKGDAIYLRRTKEPRYFESISGIYFGMDKDEVLRLYGQPSNNNTIGSDWEWKYDREGFEVYFIGNVVAWITIYPHGNRRFDRSGLSAKSAGIEFLEVLLKYGRTSYIDIGYGERIYFHYDGSVALGRAW